eukprot:644814-Hanusia_phi.AAC.3
MEESCPIPLVLTSDVDCCYQENSSEYPSFAATCGDACCDVGNRGASSIRSDALSSIVLLEQVFIRLGNISVTNLFPCALVCKGWMEALQSDDVWRALCDEIWKRSGYWPENLERLRDKNPKQAYLEACKDIDRTELTLEELCGFRWYFRFKKAAGSHWTDSDPYWNGMPARFSCFTADGSLTRMSSEVTDEAEHNTYFPTLTWRWGNSRSLQPASGSPCGRVRVSVEGRDVPTYVVSRHPKHRGFLMQSCWAVMSSFPLPPPREDPDMEDEALSVTLECQQTEVFQYNFGSLLPTFPVRTRTEDDGDEEREDEPSVEVSGWLL